MLIMAKLAFFWLGTISIYIHTNTYTVSLTCTFAGAKSNVDVLLLSLEHSASGTNLTCANHVTLCRSRFHGYLINMIQQE